VSGDEEESDQMSDHYASEEHERKLHQSTSGKINSQHHLFN
jgi:hypothetical protein